MEPSQRADSRERQVSPEERRLFENEQAKLTAYIRRQARLARIHLRLRQGIGVTTILATLLILCLNTLQHRATLLPLFWLMLSSILSLVGINLWYHQHQQKSMPGMSTTLQGVWMVGALLEALAFPDQYDKSHISRELVALLPQLKATDGTYLTAQQRETMRRTLTGWDAPLMLSVLQAYRQIGDERDMEAVESLIKKYDGTPRHSPILEAAKECLPFLQAKAQQRRSSQTLLRASEQSAAAPLDLLRPANTAEPTDPEQLLRPTTEQTP